MSHYEERLEHDLERIRESLAGVGVQVEGALRDAVHALLTGNEAQANEIILGDAPINRAVRRLDNLCHKFIAVHLPSAGHLRLISSVMRTAIALERIGDYAVTICREAGQLSKVPDGLVAREIESMADASRSMLHQSMAAFSEGNAEAARATMATADQVERSFDTVFEHLVADDSERSKKDLFALLVIFHELERVSDQAKNICEEVVFAVTGESKAPKLYRILFLDEANAGLSQMAEAIARKNFPHSGEFRSAGKRAADAIDPSLETFLLARGCEVKESTPEALDDITTQELADYHIIVSLQGPIKNFVEQVPFHTAALEWDIGALPDASDSEQADRHYEKLYREIALKMRDLMTVLHGERGD